MRRVSGSSVKVTSKEAALSQLAPQADRGQAWIGGQPVPQVGREGVRGPGPRRARAVGGRLEPEGDVFADRLAVDAELAGDGSGPQPLPVKLHGHDKFPKSNHRNAPPA